MSKQRDRGRLLTTEALTKLQQAIRDWEVQHERKCTQERIKELTGEFKEGGLDPGTISKIRKGKEGVDSESIHCLFRTFGLQLEEADLVAAIAFITQSDPNFVGREGAIADLKTLTERGTKVIVIQARGGVGKTTLARKYLQQEFSTFLEFPIAKETKDIASVESLLEEKLRQLGEEPGREFLVSIDRLKRKLQSERIGILIDNLEPALDSAGKLIEVHRRYVELLRVLADPTVQSVTLITTRERLREPSITVQPYLLRSLDVAAWETYFRSRNIATEGAALSALHNAYGGNAKAMDILSGAIVEDFSGGIAEYWQVNQDDLLIERDLEDLVTAQFNRIQELDRNAYNLLCRMGCYRYQDVPRVPIEGLLCLLWDVAEGQQRRVVKALQDRSLVDCQDGEYWLHPVIRGEAIGRLRVSKDWEIANQKIAEFWTDAVIFLRTMEDAIKALEACFHYIDINNFNLASDVIFNGRQTYRHNTEYVIKRDVTFLLTRFGVLQQLILLLSKLEHNVDSDIHRVKIHQKLAALFWRTGLLQRSISYYQKTLEIANKINYKEFAIISSLGIAVCKIDLGEFKEAISIFELIEEQCSGTELDVFAKNSWFSLAFLNSILGQVDKAYYFIHKCSLAISSQDRPEELLIYVHGGLMGKEYRLFLMGTTYRILGETEKSFEMYRQAIQYADKDPYHQIKAKSLDGLAQLYREVGNFETSISYHISAIEVLERISAKCDLAEAYYQLGLTHQTMGDICKCDENFQKAIRLFKEMEAPKRVERVRRSLENYKEEKP